MSQLLHCTRHRSFTTLDWNWTAACHVPWQGSSTHNERLEKGYIIDIPARPYIEVGVIGTAPHLVSLCCAPRCRCYSCLALFLVDLFVSLCLTLRSCGLHLLPFLECDCLYIFTLILSLLHFCCTSLLRSFYCEHLTDIYLYVCSHVRALHTLLHLT